MTKTLRTLAVALAAIACCSCTSDETDAPVISTPEISFGVGSQNTTRVSPTTIETIGSFGVTCVRKASESSYYFQSQPYIGAVSSGFSHASGMQYFWLNLGETYDFYAWSPSSHANLTVTNTTPNAPVLTFQTPTAADLDLLGARALDYPDNWGQTVNFTFNHLLAGVAFKATGSDCPEMTITQIKIEGVDGKGVCNLADDTWSEQSTTTSYTITPNVAISPENVDITPNGQLSLMTIPQTLTDAAKITVTINGTIELTSTLVGEWKAGKTTTYIISIRGDKLDVSVKPWNEYTGEDILKPILYIDEIDAKDWSDPIPLY